MGSMSKKIAKNARKTNEAWNQSLMEMTIPERKSLLYRNGITEKDLQKAYDQGRKDADRVNQDFCFRTVYAAFLITMIDKHGMDRDEAVALLREIDNQVVVCVDHSDLTQEAYERTGLELCWDDPIERIQ